MPLTIRMNRAKLSLTIHSLIEYILMNSPYLKNLGPINYDSAEGQQKQLLEKALN